jgi:hypothetical protein
MKHDDIGVDRTVTTERGRGWSGVVDEDRKVRAVILELDRTGQWGQVFSQALNIIPLFFLQYYKLFFS